MKKFTAVAAALLALTAIRAEAAAPGQTFTNLWLPTLPDAAAGVGAVDYYLWVVQGGISKKLTGSSLLTTNTPQVISKKIIDCNVNTCLNFPGGAGGNGNVAGPAGAADGNLAVYNGSTGKIIKDSLLPQSSVVTLNAPQTMTLKTLTAPTVILPTSCNGLPDGAAYMDLTTLLVHGCSTTAVTWDDGQSITWDDGSVITGL